MKENRSSPPDTVPFGAIDVPAGEKAARVRAVFDNVAERYDLMNDLMSFGTHRLWKAAAIDWLMPRPNMQVVDVAGGTGDLAIGIARRMGGAEAIGAAGGAITLLDINAAMVGQGRARIDRKGLGAAIGCAVADAEQLPLPGRSADLYVIGFGLRNVTRPEAALAEAYRVLRPGGRFLCLEFSRPVWPLLGPAYARYSDTILPRLGRRITGDADAYRYLVDSIRRFPPQERLAEMVSAAGFERIAVRNLTGGIAAMHSGWRL